jgi:hypothetical protein
MGNNSLDFESLVLIIEQTHKHFQHQAVKAVNFSLTVRNWLVGFYIAEFELNGKDRASYGDKLFDVLAQRFKHVKGVDRRSLYRFKDFYIYYPQLGIEIEKQTQFLKGFAYSSIVGSLTPLLENKLFVPSEMILNNLSYTHIEQLLSIDEPVKRRFYEIAAIEGTWSVNELKRQINSLYYERTGISVKPEILKEFNHHNIGQLNTYVSYFRAEIMQSDDNPTIGILLVTNKNKALVEYATSGMDNKLFVSKYLIELPRKEDLEAFISNELTTHIGV